jgi:exosortase
VGMIAFLQGAVLYVWGRDVYRGLAFPLLYLFLAVPLPRTVLVAATGSLKTLGAAVAGKTLAWLGFAVVRDGAILKFPMFTLVVADECSGLQSLVTLSVASLPVAYLMNARLRKRVLIVLASLPLALAANVLRLDVTAVLAHKFGKEIALSWPHTVIGVAIVFLAFLLLYGISNAFSDEKKDRRG